MKPAVLWIFWFESESRRQRESARPVGCPATSRTMPGDALVIRITVGR